MSAGDASVAQGSPEAFGTYTVSVTKRYTSWHENKYTECQNGYFVEKATV